MHLVREDEAVTNFGGLPLLPNQLANELLWRAVWVENRLDKAERHGMGQQEETITEMVLLDLAEALPALKITMYTHLEENRETGADWIWWWRGSTAWFGGLVQAKKLKTSPSGRHSYEIGGRPKDYRGVQQPRQIDRLRGASDRLRVPAMYALYNPSTPGHQRATACPLGLHGSSAEGVTVLDAKVAASLLQLNAVFVKGLYRLPVALDLASAAEHARPWSCLATCASMLCPTWPPAAGDDTWRTLGFGSEPDVDDLAYQAAYFTYLVSRSMLRGQFSVATEPQTYPYVAQGVRLEAPSYVYSPELLQGSWVGNDDADVSPGDVGRVVIIERADG